MKKLVVFALLSSFILFAGTVFASEYKGNPISAKFATEEIEGEMMTVFAHKFADDMKSWSDGKINIDIFPYGSLGGTRDIAESAQLGVIEYVFTDSAWISSLVPEAQTLALHFLFPREKGPETLAWVVKNGSFMPALEKAFRRSGLVPLGAMWEGWQWITSKDPINTMADLKGVKLRLMGSKVLMDQWRAYGAAPTPMSFGEIYGGLQMGLIDAQMQPLFGNYGMKFYEVTDFQTAIYAEAFIGIPSMNAKAYDSLPPNVQQKVRQWWADAAIPAAKWLEDRTARDKASIEKDRPVVKFTELSDDKIEEFRKIGKANYSNLMKHLGKDGQKVLDALEKDIANAQKALGN